MAESKETHTGHQHDEVREVAANASVDGSVSGPDEGHSDEGYGKPGWEMLPETPRKGWRRPALLVALGLVSLPILLVAALAIRLLISPLSVHFLFDDVQALFASRLSDGQSIELDDVQISFARQGRLALSVTGMTLTDGSSTLLSVPKVDLELSLLSLMKGEIHTKTIYVPRMQIAIRRDKDGRFLIAGQDPGTAGPVMGPPVRSQAVFYDPDEPEFISLIYGMRRAIQPLANDDLDQRPPRILVKNTEVSFFDEVMDKARLFENVAFSYNPIGEDDNLWRIDFAADGYQGRIGFAMAEFPISEKERGTEGRSIRFRFADLSLADFAPRFADRSQDLQFSAPIDGVARLDFNNTGVLVDLKLKLNVGGGQIDFGPGDTALLDEAAFEFDWNPEMRMLHMQRGSIYFGKTGGRLQGWAVWPTSRQGDVRIAVEGADIMLNARDNPHPPKSLKRLTMQARIGRQSGLVSIDRFAMIADEGSVEAAGSIGFENDELTMGLAVQVSPMPYDLFAHMWPVSVANGARMWVIENVEGGYTTGGTIDVSVTDSMFKRNEEGRMVLPDDSIHAQFGLREVRVRGFEDLPPAEKLSGTGVVTGRTFVADITGGRFVTKSKRHFTIESGRFEIPDHSMKPTEGILNLEGKGLASVLGEIVDSEPMEILKSEKLQASKIKGKAHAKVKLAFPLIKDLREEQVSYDASVQLQNFTSDLPVRDRLISDADLTIETDGQHVEIGGTGKVDGLEAAINVSTSTDNSLALSSNVSLVLSDADRRKLGLPLDDWLRGPVPIKIKQTAKQMDRYFVSADLTKAVLSFPEIGWKKNKNVRGEATFEVIQKGKAFEILNIRIEGDGFSATGGAELDRKDGLKRLVIDQLQLSRGDLLTFKAVQTGKDAYKLSLNGALLDLRGRLQGGGLDAGGRSGKSGNRSSYDLDISLAKVIGLSGHVISNLKGTYRVARGLDNYIQMRGKIDGRSSIAIDTKKGKAPTVHISTDNAGALFRFVGAVDKVVGGRLAMSATLSKGWETVAGSVHLTNFYVQGQVQKTRSKKSTVERVNSKFDKFNVSYSGNKGVYSLNRGVVKGPALGATVGGTIDMRNRQLSLSGTYIPVYAVNNIFSRLPILGRALGNRKNEGLLGITYKIKGSMANPKIFVNPASLLAPGALRKMFEF